MTNRLSKLRRDTPGVTGERPPAVTVSPSDPFKPFWDKYNAVDSKVQDIAITLDEIQNLQDDIKKELDSGKAADKRGELHEKLNSITASSTVIRNEIEALKREVDENKLEGADMRLEQNHLHVLSTSFANVINKFTTIQEEVKKGFAHDVSRHYKTAGINIDEIEAERIISQNPDVLQQNIFTLQGNGAQMETIVNTYNKIAARHEDILQIERSMQELMELFVQFSVIVKDQGRQIDNIEANIASASNYVAKGTENLDKAAADQKTSRKCLYWMLGIALIVLIGIIVIIVVKT